MKLVHVIWNGYPIRKSWDVGMNCAISRPFRHQEQWCKTGLTPESPRCLMTDGWSMTARELGMKRCCLMTEDQRCRHEQCYLVAWNEAWNGAVSWPKAWELGMKRCCLKTMEQAWNGARQDPTHRPEKEAWYGAVSWHKQAWTRCMKGVNPEPES